MAMGDTGIAGDWHQATETVDGPMSDLDGAYYDLNNGELLDNHYRYAPVIAASNVCIAGVSPQPYSNPSTPYEGMDWDHPYGARTGIEGSPSVGLVDTETYPSAPTPGYVSWNRGSIWGWYLPLDYYEQLNPWQVQDPSVSIPHWMAAIENADSSSVRITHWTILASTDNEPDSGRASGQVQVNGAAFGQYTYYFHEADPDPDGVIASLTWDYYQAADNIGTYEDDRVYPWVDAQTVATRGGAWTDVDSAAVASAAGLPFGRQAKSGYWDRFYAALTSGVKKLSLPNVLGRVSGSWQVPDPPRNDAGKRHLRLFACPSTTTEGPATSPPFNAPDWTLSSHVPFPGGTPAIVWRTGPVFSSTTVDYVISAGPPPITVTPTYYPLDWRYVYYSPQDVQVGPARAGAPMDLTIITPWDFYQADKMTGITYTVDWGDGTAHSVQRDNTAFQHVYADGQIDYEIVVYVEDDRGGSLYPWYLDVQVKLGAMDAQGRSFGQDFLRPQG